MRVDLSDEGLMGRAQRGDTDAFAALYDRHAERAFRVARAICRDRSHAEDAVQEAFLAIWRSRDSFRTNSGSFKAWSMQIVRNRAIDTTRRAATRPPAQIGDADPYRPEADVDSVTPADAALATSEREMLLATISRLPDVQAEVIVLAFYGELSHSEIAAQLDLPSGTVKGRIRLGLEKLRYEIAFAEAASESD